MARVVNAKKRQWWLGEFERQSVKAGLYGPGKVCWDMAIHLYNQGLSVETCILRMVEQRQQTEVVRNG